MNNKAKQKLEYISLHAISTTCMHRIAVTGPNADMLCKFATCHMVMSCVIFNLMLKFPAYYYLNIIQSQSTKYRLAKYTHGSCRQT